MIGSEPLRRSQAKPVRSKATLWLVLAILGWMVCVFLQHCHDPF